MHATLVAPVLCTNTNAKQARRATLPTLPKRASSGSLCWERVGISRLGCLKVSVDLSLMQHKHSVCAPVCVQLELSGESLKVQCDSTALSVRPI